MSRALLLALACSGIALVAVATPIPRHLMKDQPIYYPMQVGAKWVYLRGGQELTLVVAKVERKQEERIVEVDQVTNDGTRQPWQTVSVRPEGLFLLPESGNPYDPPICTLKLPYRPGVEWALKSDRGQNDRVAGKKISISRERLQVPAGVFDTIRVETEYTALAGRGNSKATHWYAPDCGLVQISTDADQPGKPPYMVLKSFTPGKE